MKKYMITAAAFLLVAGMANAQLATKETVKTTPKPVMTSKTSTPHKAGTVTAAPSTPSASTRKQSTASATIKRKHHTKKTNPLKKTVNN